MSTSPFEGTNSPYGPADPSLPPTPTAAPAVPITRPQPTSAPFAAPPYSPGVAPLPAYQLRTPLPQRPRNVAGGWALGLGIAGFVFTGIGLVVNPFGSTLAVAALALGILGLVLAQRRGLPRATSIWGIALVVIPVLATLSRVLGAMVDRLGQLT